MSSSNKRGVYVLKENVAENLRTALEGSEDAFTGLLLSLFPSLEAHDPLARKFLVQFQYQSIMNRWESLCQGCSSNCCRSLIVVSPFDVERMAKFLEMSIQDFLERHTKETYCEGIEVTAMKGPSCQFLNEKGRCAIYPARPNCCVFYPFLSFGIQTDVERIIAPEDCPTGMKVHEYFRENETDRLHFLEGVLDKIRSQKKQCPQ